MDPNHILSPGERRQLRANLPPTPLPVEIQTPSVFSGPYTSAVPIGNDQNRDIPLHRRLFSTGRYQDRRDLANSPQEKDYFSLQPGREKYFIMKELTEGIYDPILKAAEKEEHRREDEAFMAWKGPKTAMLCIVKPRLPGDCSGWFCFMQNGFSVLLFLRCYSTLHYLS